MDKMKTNYFHTTDVKELSIDGTTVTSTAAELNTLDGITSTVGELNAMENAGIVSMTTTTTPASGSCEVQLVFKDIDDVTLAVPVAGLLYVSEVATGLTNNPVDGLAVATYGVLANIVSHGTSCFISSAAGLLGLTITHAGADSFWVVIVLPNSKLLISDECVVQA
jgi:hypothetical protein